MEYLIFSKASGSVLVRSNIRALGRDWSAVVGSESSG